MTSGTSGCAQHDIVEENRKVEHFVEANFDALRHDVSVGSGEYLTALSATLGCGWYALHDFSDVTRQHYDYLFFNQDPTDAGHAVGKLRHILDSNPELRQNCGGA